MKIICALNLNICISTVEFLKMAGNDTVTPVVLYHFRKSQILMIHNDKYVITCEVHSQLTCPCLQVLLPKKRLNWLFSDICTKSSCLPGTEHFNLVKHCIQHPYDSNNQLYTLGSCFSVVSMEITALPSQGHQITTIRGLLLMRTDKLIFLGSSNLMFHLLNEFLIECIIFLQYI